MVNDRNVSKVKVDNFANNKRVGGICETDHTNVSQKLINVKRKIIAYMISLMHLVVNADDKYGEW